MIGVGEERSKADSAAMGILSDNQGDPASFARTGYFAHFRVVTPSSHAVYRSQGLADFRISLIR